MRPSPCFLALISAAFPVAALAQEAPAPSPSPDSPDPAPALTVAAPDASTPPTDPPQAVAAPVKADKPSPALAVEIEARGYKFYGWQSMAIEGLGAAGVAGIALAESFGGGGGGGGGAEAAVALGALAYVVGGFAVQGFHGKWGKAVGSLGITLGVPGTGALIGLAAASADCHSSECQTRYVLVGTAIGVAAAPLIDGLSLGWERKRNTYHAPTASIVPTIIPVPGGAAIGVAGTSF